MQIFRKRLRNTVDDAKKRYGLKQTELAKKMGITPERLNKWLTTMSEPKLVHVVLLCKELGTHPNYLLGEDDDPTPPNERQVENKLNQILDMIKS